MQLLSNHCNFMLELFWSLRAMLASTFVSMKNLSLDRLEFFCFTNDHNIISLSFTHKEDGFGFSLCVDLIPYRVRVLYAALNVFISPHRIKVEQMKTKRKQNLKASNDNTKKFMI